MTYEKYLHLLYWTIFISISVTNPYKYVLDMFSFEDRWNLCFAAQHHIRQGNRSMQLFNYSTKVVYKYHQWNVVHDIVPETKLEIDAGEIQESINAIQCPTAPTMYITKKNSYVAEDKSLLIILEESQLE